MVAVWLQQVSSHRIKTCSDRNEGTLSHQYHSGEYGTFAARGPWNIHCGGSWRDPARAVGQLTGRPRGLTACLKTGPAVSTFLAGIDHVNRYKSSRLRWLWQE